MSYDDKVLTNSEVSRMIDVGDSTLRKYCLELKKNGYNFYKETNKTRSFDNHDLYALTFFKELIKLKGKTKEEAAIVVAARYRRDEQTGRTKVFESEENRSIAVQLMDKLDELLNEIQKSNQNNEKILAKLDELIDTNKKKQILEIRVKEEKEQ